MAFISFFAILSIFGLDVIGAKEVTLSKQSRNEIVSSIILFRLILSITLIAFISLTAYLFINSNEQRLIVILYSFILISYGLNVNFFFQGIERMEYIAVFKILSAIIILCGVLILVHLKQDIYVTALIYSVGNIIVSIVRLAIFHKMFMNIKFEINFNQLKKLIFDAFPLVISGLMIAIYYNLDIIMLRFMKTEFEVGIYSAAYKIFLVFIIPFGLIFQSYQPKLTKFITVKPGFSPSIFRSYSILMLTFALLSGAFLYFQSNWIVLTLYKSDYILAVGPLSILAMNIFIVGVNILFGNPLTVWEKQKLYTVAVSSGALCNIILNIILIPKYSYIGAAFATLLSEVVVFIGVVMIFNKTISKLVLK